jgi:hypothetical protein
MDQEMPDRQIKQYWGLASALNRAEKNSPERPVWIKQLSDLARIAKTEHLRDEICLFLFKTCGIFFYPFGDDEAAEGDNAETVTLNAKG